MGGHPSEIWLAMKEGEMTITQGNFSIWFSHTSLFIEEFNPNQPHHLTVEMLTGIIRLIRGQTNRGHCRICLYLPNSHPYYWSSSPEFSNDSDDQAPITPPTTNSQSHNVLLPSTPHHHIIDLTGDISVSRGKENSVLRACWYTALSLARVLPLHVICSQHLPYGSTS